MKIRLINTWFRRKNSVNYKKEVNELKVMLEEAEKRLQPGEEITPAMFEELKIKKINKL
jgi:hypothetical protein